MDGVTRRLLMPRTPTSCLTEITVDVFRRHRAGSLIRKVRPLSARVLRQNPSLLTHSSRLWVLQLVTRVCRASRRRAELIKCDQAEQYERDANTTQRRVPDTVLITLRGTSKRPDKLSLVMIRPLVSSVLLTPTITLPASISMQPVLYALDDRHFGNAGDTVSYAGHLNDRVSVGNVDFLSIEVILIVPPTRVRCWLRLASCPDAVGTCDRCLEDASLFKRRGSEYYLFEGLRCCERWWPVTF